MKGRTFGLAALAILIGLMSLTGARAQNNLDAGKPPSRLFSDTCAVCHKSPRGLLKSVSGSALPGFLRQHYTTGPDMASALAGYLMSSGAAERVPDPPARAQKNQQAREQAKEGAEPSAKQKRQRAAPDADGLQSGEASAPSTRQKAAKKGKAGKNEVAEPKPEVKPEAKPEREPDAKPPVAASEPPKAEPEKPVEAAKPAEPASAEASKSETAKSEPSKSEPLKSEPAPVEQAKPAPATTSTDNAPARADTAPAAPPQGRVSRPAGLTLPGFPPPVAEEPAAEAPASKPSAQTAPKSEIPQIEPAKVDIGGSASEPPKASTDKPGVEAVPVKEQSGEEETFGRQAAPKPARKKNAAPPQ